MAPGSRHKGDFPKDAGSVGTRFTGHRAQHWVGVCRSEDLVGSAGDSSWQQQGGWNRVGVRSQTEEGVPPALRQVCRENTAGRPRTERPAVPAHPLVATRSLSSHGEGRGVPLQHPIPGACGGLRRKAWEEGFSSLATRQAASSSPAPGWVCQSRTLQGPPTSPPEKSVQALLASSSARRDHPLSAQEQPRGRSLHWGELGRSLQLFQPRPLNAESWRWGGAQEGQARPLRAS